jgi:hypothetical protein
MINSYGWVKGINQNNFLNADKYVGFGLHWQSVKSEKGTNLKGKNWQFLYIEDADEVV